MKTKFAILMFLSNSAFAFQDEATVVRVDPAYNTIQVPYNDCYMERVPVRVAYPNGRSVYRRAGADSALGAVVGGVIGNSIGKGDGRKAATAAGALLGWHLSKDEYTVMGSTVTEYREIEQCRTLYTEKTVEDGYIVTYEYMGKIGSTKMRYYPGKTISVNVNVTPN